MRIKGVLFFLLIIWHSLVFAKTKLFQHITNADGLSQSEVYAILEDSRGFMWFGTVDGLNQYDGYNITIFNTDRNNPNSISNNTIRSLEEDPLGRIWIGTDNGLCVYNPSTEKIVQVKIGCIDKGLILPIRSIIFDKDHLLLGTTSGLLRAKLNTSDPDQIGQNFYWVKFSENYRSNILDLEIRKDGSIWTTTLTSLYGMFFPGEDQKPILIEELNSPSFYSNNSLEEDKNGNLWIVSITNGIYRYSSTSKKMDHFLLKDPSSTINSNKLSSIVSDKDGNIWISSREKGLFFLEANQLNADDPQFEIIKNIPYNEKSLNSNLISTLYVSKNNLLWIGTIGSGINIYDPQQKEFNHFKIPLNNNEVLSSSNFIRSVLSDRSGNIWLGTHNNGLYILNRKNSTFKKAGFGNESLFFMYNMSNGSTLVCSTSGVKIVKLVNDDVQILDAYFSEAYFYACKSMDNTIWLAGLNGITKCKEINGKLEAEMIYHISTNPGMSFNRTRVLYYDNVTNEILAGTEGGGLNILELDDNQNVIRISVFKKEDSLNSISNNYIRSITIDSNGNTWVGTYEGLNKLLRDSSGEVATFRSYTLKDGLPNNMIQSLIEDNQKNLWIGTNKGLSKFDLQREQFTNYSASEGLQSNEFSEHTVFKKADGEIIFGGINGINVFYPENIRSNDCKPKTTITGLYLFNRKVEISVEGSKNDPLSKSIVLTDTLLLKPNQTSFGFVFSAMLHSNSGKIKYAYKLDGFDKDWNYTDAKNRIANYTNLKSGKYFFMVKSTNIDGKWEETPRTIFIRIRTPFVYTWMAFVIYILIIFLIIVYFTNYSVIRYTTKKKMYLDNEHNKMMHELDELRSRFFINISHDLRTPLTLISSPLELVLKNKELQPDVKNYLNLIQRNVRKLKDITEQLLDFSKAEAGKLQAKLQSLDIVLFLKKEAVHFTQAINGKGLEFNIISTEESIYTGFDTDMISKVFFNLLSNAIKHTQKGEINVMIERVSQDLPDSLRNGKYNRFVRIDVQDSGDGIEQQDLSKIFDRFFQGKGKSENGYGIGLSHSKAIIEALDGCIQVSSELGVGTTFHIYIPDVKTEINQEKESFETLSSEDLYIESLNNPESEESLHYCSNLQKILIIDDNQDMREFIRQELKKEYNIYESEDGMNGLEMAKKTSPDLIITDIMMPKMDGLEFCKRIKSDIKTSHIPVILLTAKTDTPTKYKGMELGADDYISKPFEIEFLVLRIKNLLRSRDQLRRLFQINNSLDPSAVTVSSLDEKFLSQLMTAMEKGIPDPDFTVTSLESTMGMSHANFYRKIKNLTGQSGKDILLNIRMKRARQILTDNPGVRISEVAYMVGYSNPKYFSQSFKEFYGILPSEINSEN